MRYLNPKLIIIGLFIAVIINFGIMHEAIKSLQKGHVEIKKELINLQNAEFEIIVDDSNKKQKLHVLRQLK